MLSAVAIMYLTIYAFVAHRFQVFYRGADQTLFLHTHSDTFMPGWKSSFKVFMEMVINLT